MKALKKYAIALCVGLLLVKGAAWAIDGPARDRFTQMIGAYYDAGSFTAGSVAGDMDSLRADSAWRLRVTDEGPVTGAWYATQTNTGATAVTNSAGALKAAGASGVKNVLTHFDASVTPDATGGAQFITVQVKDGSTVVWQRNLSVPAGAYGYPVVADSGPVFIVGTAATAMTVTFSAGVGTNATTQCNMNGFTTK